MEHLAHVPLAARSRLDLQFAETDESLARYLPSPRGDQVIVADYLLHDGDVIIETLCAVARAKHWSADTLHDAVNDYIGPRTDEFYATYHSRVITAAAFRDQIATAIRTRPSWRLLQTTLRALTRRAAPSPSVDLRKPMARGEFAEAVGRSVVTIHRWIKNGKVKTNKVGLIPRSELERVLKTRPDDQK